ncbi:unnamed protein product [Schistosoma margrebowiei]|uniref:Uncharacterized protein n=1 Tax=Schistosoma margrebowiei TaxID=48269 RepID=A0A3P7YQJ3_9TREM|nr:unnamed protein product [Schistosoma margrebowiei]
MVQRDPATYRKYVGLQHQHHHKQRNDHLISCRLRLLHHHLHGKGNHLRTMRSKFHRWRNPKPRDNYHCCE